MKFGRAAWWWAGGPLILLVLSLVAGEAAGWPFLQRPLQRAMAHAANVPVALDGKFHARFLWHPELQIGRLHVAAGGGINVPHLLDAEGVELAWQWLDIWHWHQGQALRVERLQAKALDAQLVRVDAGHASWQLGSLPPTGNKANSGADWPRFGTLLVGRGNILLDDQVLDSHVQIAIKGTEGEDANAARYEATAVGRYHAAALNLKLRTGGVLPLTREGDEGAPMVPLRVEGQAGAARVLFDGQAAALLGERRLQGTFRVQGSSLAQVARPLGVTLPQTPSFDLQGQLGHTAGVWHVQAEHATIGQSSLGGDFSYDTRQATPRLTGRLWGRRLALADLGPAVGKAPRGDSTATGAKGAATETAATPATPATPAATGRVLPQRRLDLPSLRLMDADVQVGIDELDFGTSALAPLRQLQTSLVLTAGVLQLQSLQAVVAGGRFSGETALDANLDPARWTFDVQMKNVDVAGWLKGVQSPEGKTLAAQPTQSQALKTQRERARQGGDQPVQAYLTGSLEGSLRATGRGNSVAEFLGHLDGSSQLALRDGSLSHLLTELAGLDVAQALGVWVRGDRPLPLRCAHFDLVAAQGVVRPRLAVLDNSDSTLRIAGQINLRDESLALRATVAPKDFSPLTLRTPVTVTGSFGQPAVGVEGKRLAGKVLGAVALGAVAGPLAALLPLVDMGEPQGADPCVGSAPAVSAASSRAPSPKPSAAQRTPRQGAAR